MPADNKDDPDPFLHDLTVLKGMLSAPPPVNTETMVEEASPSFADSALLMELEQECQQRKDLDSAVDDLLASRRTLEVELDDTKQHSDKLDRDCGVLQRRRLEMENETLSAMQQERENVTQVLQETEAAKRALMEAEAREKSLIVKTKEMNEKILEQEQIVKGADQNRKSEKMRQHKHVVTLLTELKQVRADLKKMEFKAAELAKTAATNQSTHSGPAKKICSDVSKVVDAGNRKRAADAISNPRQSTEPSQTVGTSPSNHPEAVSVGPDAPIGTNTVKKVEDAVSSSSLNYTELTEKGTVEKRQKSLNDWIGHAMNIQQAIVESHRHKFLSDIVQADLPVLQGIGAKEADALRTIRLRTVRDLGEYKFYKIAKAIKTLSAKEGKRLPSSRMNLDNCLDKEHEHKSLKQILELPVSALQGLSATADDALKELKVFTIRDFANFKYAAWAEALVTLAPFEETKTVAERKYARAIHKLE